MGSAGWITCPALVGYGNYDGIAPARNSTNIASRIRGAELHGYEGGHGFLFQDPAALPAFIAFLRHHRANVRARAQAAEPLASVVQPQTAGIA